MRFTKYFQGAQLELADETGMAALNKTAQAGKVDAARLLLDRGAKLDVADRFGNTPAMTAAKSGGLELLKLLLDRDTSALTRCDDSGFTLRHGAADHAHLDVVEYLLGRGVNVNSRSADGYTPLHAAANGAFTNEVQYVAVIQQLLAHEADVNARMHGGHTALHRAALWDHPQIIQVLLAASARPHLRDEDGKTALGVAKDSRPALPAALPSRGSGPP